MSLTMTLNGAAIDMGTVEFNTTVMHGRSTVTDIPTGRCRCHGCAVGRNFL